MAELSCPECGRLLDPRDLACPTCGEPAPMIIDAGPTDELPLPSGTVRLRSAWRRRRVLDAEFALTKDGSTPISPNRSMGLVLAILGILLVLVVAAWGSYFLSRGSSSSSPPQVILVGGSHENLTGGIVGGSYFSISKPAELEGSFAVAGDPASVFVCYESECSGGDTYGLIGYTYDTGWVQGGTLHVWLNGSGLWGVVGWPEPTSQSPAPTSILTWTSPLEVVSP